MKDLPNEFLLFEVLSIEQSEEWVGYTDRLANFCVNAMDSSSARLNIMMDAMLDREAGEQPDCLYPQSFRDNDVDKDDEDVKDLSPRDYLKRRFKNLAQKLHDSGRAKLKDRDLADNYYGPR